MVWFETPLALGAIPVAAAVLYYVTVASGAGSKRRRYAIFLSRFAVVGLLVVAFAQPFVVETTTVQGEQRVQILIDDSDSTEVFEDVGEEIAAGVEQQGINVRTTRIGKGDSSPVGDALVSNIESDGNVLLITDGHTTSGRSLGGAAASANSLNAQVSAVKLEPTEAETYVSLKGPGKVSQGVEETFEVCLGGASPGNVQSSVTVDIGGETAFQESVSAGCEEFKHTFENTGEYRMTATSGADDTYDRNDVFRRTVRVVEKPKVLYVSPNQYPLLDLLDQLYDVETRSKVPSDLSGYQAVVTQNLPANSAGDLSALQEFVIDGNGLLVAGGPNAYGNGGYDESILGDMVPVRSGSPDRTGDVVLLLDVSGSADGDLSRIRGLGLDAIESMGDGNRAGLAFFDHRPHPNIVPLGDLSSNRAEMRQKIRTLNPQSLGKFRGSDISAGLRAAEKTLNGAGDVVVVSDGLLYDDPPERGILDPAGVAEAKRLNRKGINIYTVGVGEQQTDHRVMRSLAELGGGTYIRGTRTERLKLFFGGSDKSPEGSGLSIINGNHFITQGVETPTDLPTANDVKTKPTGKFLVSTGKGETAMASGRYGLGRVVSVTAHTGDGVLGGLLQQPDSTLVSRAVNWVIGDPQRGATDVFSVEDTRVGEATEVSYTGSSAPSTEIDFSKRGSNEYVAAVTPSETGFESVGDTEYAVNYAREYGGFGMSNSVLRAVDNTGGSVYEPGQTEAIAEEVRAHQTQQREAKQGLDWIPLALALLLYLTEVSLRRLHDVYGYSIGRVVPGWT
jgi:hypothetical protein